jgi:hypothetical protein
MGHRRTDRRTDGRTDGWTDEHGFQARHLLSLRKECLALLELSFCFFFIVWNDKNFKFEYIVIVLVAFLIRLVLILHTYIYVDLYIPKSRNLVESLSTVKDTSANCTSVQTTILDCSIYALTHGSLSIFFNYLKHRKTYGRIKLNMKHCFTLLAKFCSAHFLLL